RAAGKSDGLSRPEIQSRIRSARRYYERSEVPETKYRICRSKEEEKMTELIVGKYKFYPYECERCKESSLRELEGLLKSARNEKRRSACKKAKQPQRT